MRNFRASRISSAASAEDMAEAAAKLKKSCTNLVAQIGALGKLNNTAMQSATFLTKPVFSRRSQPVVELWGGGQRGRSWGKFLQAQWAGVVYFDSSPSSIAAVRSLI